MIAAGSPVYSAPVEANGFLFIGDPHVSSVRPGRRRDPDWPEPIFAKLRKAVGIANERRLVPVLLGDLFNEAVEPDEAVKTRLMEILKAFWMPPVANVGNHDMAYTTLTYGDSLAYLAVSDAVDVARLSGPVLTLHAGGRLVGLGMTPYGQDIPRDVRGIFEDASSVVWVTHHDVNFGNAYPGAVLPFHIEGCGLVVNGHQHPNYPPVRVGGTTWTNPGNVTRLVRDRSEGEQSIHSLRDMDRIPCVWALESGGKGVLEAIALPYEREVFDLTGRLVSPLDPEATEERGAGEFAALLAAEQSSEMARSQDGSIVMEDMQAMFEREGTPDSVKEIVLSLWSDAVAKRRHAS